MYQFTFSQTVREGSLFSTPSPTFFTRRLRNSSHTDWYEVHRDLSGDYKRDILNEELKITSNEILKIDENGTSTGETYNVLNTPFDFNDFHKILNFLDNSYIKKNCADIALSVIKNGAYYGYVIPTSNGVIL